MSAAQVCVVLAAFRNASFLLMEFAVWLGNSSNASLSLRLLAKLFILGKIARPTASEMQAKTKGSTTMDQWQQHQLAFHCYRSYRRTSRKGCGR
jgi:hypothetical protein